MTATAAMLREVLKANPQRRIFVIGSGEGQRDRRRTHRGDDLHEMLESDRFEIVFLGRDGLTRILRPLPGAARESAATRLESLEDARALEDAANAAASGKDPDGTQDPDAPAATRPRE